MTTPRSPAAAARARQGEAPASAREAEEPPSKPSRTAAMVGAAAAALEGGLVEADAASGDQEAADADAGAPAAAGARAELPAERKKGAYAFPPLALLDAPKAGAERSTSAS